MEYGAIKPVAPAPEAPVVRKQEQPEPVKTDLPEEKAVSSAKEAEPQRETSNGADRPVEDAPRQLERKLYRDADTNSLVFRAINPENGDVVVQIPDDSVLRMRRLLAAYDQQEQQSKIDRTA